MTVELQHQPVLIAGRGAEAVVLDEGLRSDGLGIRLIPAAWDVPALDTRGALTDGSTMGLDDVTLAEIGRLMVPDHADNKNNSNYYYSARHNYNHRN